MLLQKDLSEFLECLNASGVRYLVVGGYAVAIHGYPRFTQDLAVFVETSEDNAARIVLSLDRFGFGSLRLTADDFASGGRCVRLGVPPHQVDILTSIAGVAFEDAWKSRVRAEFGAATAPVIGREDLIANKRASGRRQDRVDAAKLCRRK